MSIAAAPDTHAATGPLSLLAMHKSPRVRQALTAYAAASVATTTLKRARAALNEYRVFTVSVSAIDDIYNDVHAWLITQIPDARRRAVTVQTRVRSNNYAVPDSPGESIAPKRPIDVLFDGRRSQFVNIDGHRVRVQVDRDTEGVNVNAEGIGLQQVMKAQTRVQFTCTSGAARDAVLAFLESVATARRSIDRKPSVRMAARWGWYELKDVPARPIESVVLAGDLLDTLVANVGRFIDREADYVRLGQPWHYGVLLHGPPGTGKSSIVHAIAQRFGLDVYYLSLGDLAEEGQLASLLSELRPRSILLIEDVDTAGIAKTRDGADPTLLPPPVSLSGLLNALDGIVTPHGMITFLTTNKPEVLDEAITRAGRVNLRMEIDLIRDADHLSRLVTALTDRPYAAPAAFAPISSAEIVGVLMRHLDEPDCGHRAVTETVRPAARSTR